MPDCCHPNRPRIIPWHRVAALIDDCPKDQYVGKEVVHLSLPTLLLFSLTIGRTVAELCAWRTGLHCQREGAALRGRILFVTGCIIKRKGTDPCQKGQEKGDYEKEVKDAEGPRYEAGGFGGALLWTGGITDTNMYKVLTLFSSFREVIFTVFRWLVFIDSNFQHEAIYRTPTTYIFLESKNNFGEHLTVC